jgi:endonuclease/exonuclease/phosphatase (EEP) superfamily protein YafD
VVGGVLALLASVAGLAGGAWWVLDLFSHFRAQYFLGLLLAAIGLALLRRPRTALLFAVAAVGNAVLILPLYLGGSSATNPAAGSLRLLLVNVSTSNTRHDLVLDLVRDVDPDLLVLLEVDDAWIGGLAPIDDRLPHAIARPRPDNFGIALYSRRPARTHRIETLGSAAVPSIVAAFGDEDDADRQSFTLIATHPLPPSGRRNSALRNEDLRGLASLVRTIDGPVLVLGDLNATPWSHHFRRLVRETGLRDSTRGFGLQPTWPTDMLRPLRIPIDHCLVSEDLVVIDRRTGPDIGSDHLPLIIEIQP